MATTTETLKLVKPDYTDSADVGVINGNFDLIDQAIAEDRKQIVRSRNVWNLLDNSDFRNPVNQRGQSNYSGSVYGIDRWRLWDDSTSLTVNDESVTNTSNIIVQYLATVDTTKTYTLAGCTSDGSIHVLNGKFDGTDYRDAYLRFVNNQTYSGVGLLPNEWVWTALYEGKYTAETLPPYVPKGYAAELAECLRYYQKNVFLNCVKMTSSYFSVSQMLQMRCVPTVELLAFSPYGSANIYDFTGCSLTVAANVDGLQRITYAYLPTCSAHNAGGLNVNLIADL